MWGLQIPLSGEHDPGLPADSAQDAGSHSPALNALHPREHALLPLLLSRTLALVFITAASVLQSRTEWKYSQIHWVLSVPGPLPTTLLQGFISPSRPLCEVVLELGPFRRQDLGPDLSDSNTGILVTMLHQSPNCANCCESQLTCGGQCIGNDCIWSTVVLRIPPTAH